MLTRTSNLRTKATDGSGTKRSLGGMEQGKVVLKWAEEKMEGEGLETGQFRVYSLQQLL